MRAQLTFNLPEENEEYKTYMNAYKYYCALSDLQSYIRNKWKYEDIDAVLVEDLKDKFWEILEDHGVSGEF